MAIALRYVANQEDARDVVQDSFVKILTSLDHFHYQGEGSLKAWVTSIVVHQALDYVKHHECLQMTDLLPDEPEEDEPDVRRVPPDVLWRLISQLPPGYRMVLNLYVFEQMSHKEIARLLGIAPGTSTSQYARVKKELAKRRKKFARKLAVMGVTFTVGCLLYAFSDRIVDMAADRAFDAAANRRKRKKLESGKKR